jgi:hypothetical protein
MKLEDLKMLWPIFTAIVVLSGFYYTTQSRLEQLEADVQELQQADVNLSKRADKAAHEVKKLQRRAHQHKTK